MILVDSNILMYAVGAPHPQKQPALDFLEKVANGEIDAAIDAEALQEILHRYRSLNRWTEGQRVYVLARSLFSDILPITGELLEHAKELMDAYPALSARDAIHAAVVRFYKLNSICSFDRDFDGIKGCARIVP